MRRPPPASGVVWCAARITAALIAGSVALLGFGLDSLIELVSASVVIWRFTGARSQSETAERRAQKLIAACFAALALYLLYDGIRTLADGSQPATSWLGVAVSIGAIIVMPLLARAKNRVAAQLDSAAAAGDAAQSWLCAIAAGAVLVSILANARWAGGGWIRSSASASRVSLCTRAARRGQAKSALTALPSASARSRGTAASAVLSPDQLRSGGSRLGGRLVGRCGTAAVLVDRGLAAVRERSGSQHGD